jgi:hypothetical protein
MIDKGSLVCTLGAGHFQMGTVTSRRVAKNKWAYYTVKWHDNEKYEAVLEKYRELNSKGTYGRKEYKAGELFEVTPDVVTSFVNGHLDFLYSSPKVVVNG